MTKKVDYYVIKNTIADLLMIPQKEDASEWSDEDLIINPSGGDSSKNIVIKDEIIRSAWLPSLFN